MRSLASRINFSPLCCEISRERHERAAYGNERAATSRSHTVFLDQRHANATEPTPAESMKGLQRAVSRIKLSPPCCQNGREEHESAAPARGRIGSQFAVSRESIPRRQHGRADRLDHFCRDGYNTNLFHDLVLTLFSEFRAVPALDDTHCGGNMWSGSIRFLLSNSKRSLPCRRRLSHNV